MPAASAISSSNPVRTSSFESPALRFDKDVPIFSATIFIWHLFSRNTSLIIDPFIISLLFDCSTFSKKIEFLFDGVEYLFNFAPTNKQTNKQI